MLRRAVGLLKKSLGNHGIGVPFCQNQKRYAIQRSCFKEKAPKPRDRYAHRRDTIGGLRELAVLNSRLGNRGIGIAFCQNRKLYAHQRSCLQRKCSKNRGIGIYFCRKQRRYTIQRSSFQGKCSKITGQVCPSEKIRSGKSSKGGFLRSCIKITG